MSLVLEELEFKNFSSFGNLPTKVKLNDSGTTLIIGENLDEGGSSGAGKTTLLNAISYVLYDKIPSNVTLDRLINQTNDKKNTSMDASLTLTSEGRTYKITKRRGAQTNRVLLEDGKDVTPASPQAFNNKIAELVPSYRLFSYIINFNGNSRPFLDLPVGEQRALLEELFKITRLSQKAAACKTRVTQLDKELSVLRVLLEQQEKQNEVHRKHLKEANDRAARWVTQRDERVKVLEKLSTALNVFDFDTEEQLQREVTSLASQLNDLKNQRELLKTKRDGRAKEQAPQQTELALIASKIKTTSDQLTKIERELTHLRDAKCPYCKQHFAEAQAKIAENVALVSSLTSQLTEFEGREQVLKTQLAEFAAGKTADLAEYDRRATELLNASEELSAQAIEIENTLTYKTAAELNKAKNDRSITINELEQARSSVNPHLDAIAELEAEGELSIDRDQLEAQLKVQEHQQFLVKLLMDKNSFIRKNIIAKTIPYLNKRIGYYTEHLNLPHLVSFQPDMSCRIAQYGRELDHGNLSNGEKKRLNLSICLAFRDVMTYLHSKINILLTDEIDGGSLDANSVDALIGLLKRKAWDDDLSIFIISHRPEFEGRCDRNLIIRKERGFSTLITQPDA